MSVIFTLVSLEPLSSTGEENISVVSSSAWIEVTSSAPSARLEASVSAPSFTWKIPFPSVDNHLRVLRLRH